LLASTDLFGYKGKNRILLASVLEAIHTASLLHDDVVDAAKVRRGQPTAHSLWGNQIVVLVGDFLYSNALRTAVLQKSQLIMEHLSAATTRMTEGELMQLSKTADPEITEEEYLKIIEGKTGALISAACSIGAIIAGAGEEQIRILADFGLKVGMVFQMTDDILDYAAEQVALGKNLGKDLEEGKITLPIILLRGMADEEEKRELTDIITSDTRDFGQSLRRIHELFRKYHIIDISMNRASLLIEDAIASLFVFREPLNTENLGVLARYSLGREK
jgi:octaprenyl-diphosphate synthase